MIACYEHIDHLLAFNMSFEAFRRFCSGGIAQLVIMGAREKIAHLIQKEEA